MVSGRHWTDAVVAASFASRYGAPVLMTPPGGLRDDALAFLKRVGAENVHVVAAGTWPDTNVSPRVFDQLREAGLMAFGTHGADQYAIGAAIARWHVRPGSLSSAGGSAIIANGEVFADALVAGPMSYKAHVPVLLTPRDELHSEVADYLRDADIAHVVLMGGTAALSDEVEKAIRGLGIAEVDRMAGATRFETAAMTARYAADKFTGGCFGGSSVGLARARVPFDSLGAAPLLAQRCAPLVLTDPARVPPSTAGFLDSVQRRNVGRDLNLTVFGGNAAVSQEALNAYQMANPPTKYKNRSPNSVLPATDEFFINHDEVKQLLPQCPRLDDPHDQWHPNTLREIYKDQIRQSGFDTVVTVSKRNDPAGVLFSTGWYTDEKLQYYYGKSYSNPPITTEWARRKVAYSPNWNTVLFQQPTHDLGKFSYQYPDWMTGPGRDDRPGYRGLAYKLTSWYISDEWGPGRGNLESPTPWWVNHRGIKLTGRSDIDRQARISPNVMSGRQRRDGTVPMSMGGLMLYDWTSYMHQWPPLYREPAVWGLLTLLEHVDASCVYREVYELCDQPITSDLSPHLRHDEHASELGIALRNLVCGQFNESGRTLAGQPGDPGDPRGNNSPG